jgi:fumarate reductase flavoprotein subunit
VSQKDSNADIVVIGSGATGLTAALSAAEGGASVKVFEKQRSLGGTSNFFQGTFAAESALQRERYITYSRDDAFKGIMEYSHWRANARLVRAIVDESGPTIAWLQRAGVEFSDATINMPRAPRTYHIIKGQGAAFVKALASEAKKAFVEFRLGAAVLRIIKEGNRIAGVIAEEDGEEYEVAAKAVVIGSGGYGNNKEWIRKYTGFELDVNMIPVGNVDKMGDGIRMAWEAGAAEEGMGLLELYSAGPVAPEFAMGSQIELVACQPDMWVTPVGERFCDESITFYDSSLGNASARIKGGFHYRLLDESIKETIMEKGIQKGPGVDAPPGTRPLNFDAELNAALERGTTDVFVADSIEELATKLGMAPDVLKATIEEYNGFCKKGHDDLFAKEQTFLRPLMRPRFYAIKARTVFLGSLGGIRINHRTEVVDKKGKVIPGMYAGGFDAGGMWGDSYCINAASGLASAFAINSGRIAGRNASRYVKGQ